jgi:hypothetical protein
MSRMTRLRKLAVVYGPRVIAALLFITLGSMFGCGGSAGVDDGTVVGRVFSDASSVSSSKSPIGGVTVVLRRLNPNPLVVRRTLSDANGNFVFTGVPVGQYNIGYSKEGFLPIDPDNGATTTRTNLVGQDIFVESGQTVQATDVTLETNRQAGSGTLILTILDEVTGDPVTFATVTAGVVVSSNGGNNGVYTLSVPILPNDQTTRNTPLESSSKGVLIQADGYGVNQFNVGLVANETVRRTVFLKALPVIIDGLIRISRFQGLFDLSGVQIKATNTQSPLDATPLIANAAGNGLFTLSGVPASNANLTRTFNLRITHPDMQTVVITNVVAPRAGDRTIPLTIVLTPLTVDVTGTVLVQTPVVGVPVPQPDLPGNGTAVIVQTGQSGAIVNGNYTIAGVPTANHPGTLGLTLELRAFDAFGQLRSGTVQIRPLSDGSPNPIFVVPAVRLQ